MASLNHDRSSFGYDAETFPRFAASAEPVAGFEHCDPAARPMVLVKKVSQRSEHFIDGRARGP